jgi:hypothetical protein
MKNLVLLLSIIFINTSYAQDVPIVDKIPIVKNIFKFGIKVSANSYDSPKDLATVNSLDDAVGKINGINIGFYSQIKVLMLYVRPELHFTTYETNFGNVIGNIRTSRIEAPVSVGLKIIPILSGFAGPTFRYKLKGDEDKIKTITSNATMGVHFGVRVHLGKLGIDARVDQSLSEGQSQILAKNGVSGFKTDNNPNTVSVGLSYAF